MREGAVFRKTTETDVEVLVNLDGSGKYEIDTKSGFFNHMLELFAKHSQMDLKVICSGDVDVDDHHTVEDCGIAMGEAIKKALGNKEKIKRYATAFVPMDEALARVCLDISGRPYIHYDVEFECMTTGKFDAQLCEEFMRALAVNAGLTLHISVLYGKNTHHIIEAVFKAVGQAIRSAASIDESLQGVLSTKGVL